MIRHSICLGLAALAVAGCSGKTGSTPNSPAFTLREVMVPMRDGVHLQTVILTPAKQNGPLPILFTRTPYGVPDRAPDSVPNELKELAQDGYVFVIQNLRGRFKSEGHFSLSSSGRVDLKDPKATSETTDAYDTIDWLIKNVPNNNGKVGMFGVSYDGLTTAMTLLQPHPALKAISEQASPVDQWMNDDMHRYGALRESYNFEYAVMEEASKSENTHFTFNTYDTYDWYLNLGPLSNADTKYLHGSIPYWDSTMKHANYDSYWKDEAWVNQLHASSVPNLNVAGFWDQEDPWGPWQIFRHAAEHDPDHTDFMVAGPWFHGGWQGPKGDSLGLLTFGGHETAREFREQIEAPFFRYYLHGVGENRRGKRRCSSLVPTLADLSCMAAEASRDDEPVPARRWHPFVHRADGRLSGVRLRSGQPRAVPTAPDLADIPVGRLADMGSVEPGFCGSSPGCTDLREHPPRSRRHGHRSCFRQVVCIEFRDGCGLHCQAD